MPWMTGRGAGWWLGWGIACCVAAGKDCQGWDLVMGGGTAGPLGERSLP